jgi:hypothetical protein
MEIFIILAIIILIVVWLFIKKKSSIARMETTKLDIPEPKITVSIRSTPSDSFDNPNTGSVTMTHDSGWILNPRSTFPLTIYGVDQQIANELKRLLEAGYSLGTYAHARTIIPIIARSNLRCKEIDDYVKKFKPQYFSKIEELKRSSGEWASASVRDQDDLLVSFREQAVDSLDIRPYCDLEILFECEPTDAMVDDALIDRYSYDNLQLYLRYAGNLDKVRIIPAGHYERGGFEKLVEKGLAIKSTDISLHGVLETLKLKEMNDLVIDLNQKPFGRKSKAIEFLMNLPDIQQRLSKIMAFRELFQLKPLPNEFSNIDLRKISDAWRYVNEIANIIAHTYVMGGYATRNMCQEQDNLSYIKGWELSPVNDDATCPYCKRAASKSYSKKQGPKVPLHIGCRCSVLSKFKG